MTVWADTFASRTASNGFGTASDGEAWNLLSGTAADFSVGSGVGSVVGASGTGIVQLGSATGKDMEAIVRLLAGGSTDTLGLFLRITDASHFYRLDVGSLGLSVLRFGKKTGGSFTEVAHGNAPITLSTGSKYWLKFRVQGTNLYARVWATGSSEPTSWSLMSTDSSIASGGVGICCTTQAGNTDTFDSFSASTLGSGQQGNHKALGRIG